MKDCCRSEAEESVEGHRDVATCDGCGNLLIAYGNEEEFTKTCSDLEDRGQSFESEEFEELWIIAKPRAG